MMDQIDGTYDYIIVGGGTAGCVLANRLSANPKTRVLLLEAGGNDRYHWVHIPVGYLFCMGNPRTDWMMSTAPEPGLNGRSLPYPRGKVIGGCSSINGMLYLRGQAADYDGWRQMGNTGWGWDDVLPHFVKSEDHYRDDDPMHGSGGNWKVRQQRLSWEILQDVQRAAEECGIPPTEDFNRGNNEGSGFFDVNQNHGFRWNTSKAFLKPAQKRGNLRVITHALSTKIILEGKRAAGVEFLKDGRRLSVRANSEVLLSAGAINSPKLLELSGIGDPTILRENGIVPQHEVPGVGKNLQDHLQIRTVFKVKGAKTLNEMSHSLMGKAKMGLQYAALRSGPLSMAPSQFGMFAKSDPSLATPDLEYHVQPLSMEKWGDALHPFPAITMSVCNLRPQSRGTCHMQSTDPAEQPNIALNYLSAEQDKHVAVKSVAHVREIMKAKALEQYEPQEHLPGPNLATYDDLLREVGNISTTIFHPVGTCKMGTDSMAVVDPELRVRGIKGLRVIDASIMPRIVSGNTASPTIMIAEKAADLILNG